MLPDVAEVTLFGYELDVVARVLVFEPVPALIIGQLGDTGPEATFQHIGSGIYQRVD